MVASNFLVLLKYVQILIVVTDSIKTLISHSIRRKIIPYENVLLKSLASVLRLQYSLSSK